VAERADLAPDATADPALGPAAGQAVDG